MANWKPSVADMRKIRAVAAREAGMRPRQISIDFALRCDANDNVSFNDNLLAQPSDLYDNGYTKADLIRFGGVELDANGKAVVDGFVRELRIGDVGELICNIWITIATVGGKPKVVDVA